VRRADAPGVGRAGGGQSTTLVSCSHPVSSLRLLRYPVPQQESRAEKVFREAREELQGWNHRHWEAHNRAFFRVSYV